MHLLDRDTQLNQHSWYEASTNRPPYEPQAKGEIDCDLLVVGGGFAGLSAALEMAKLGYKVALLEARNLCWAASGRNGGQALPGLSSGMKLIEKQLGLASARRIWQMSCEAVELITKRITTYKIECEWAPGSITCADSPRKARDLAQELAYMQQVYGYEQQWFDRNQVRDLIASPRYYAASLEPIGGHLHPLKYGLGLARACRDAGVSMYEHSPVNRLEYKGDKVFAHTGKARLQASYALLAGNCLLEQFAPRLAASLARRIMPVGTYIGATSPLGETLARELIPGNQAVCDNSFVLDYFRFGGDTSLLFGGRVSYSTRTPRNLVGVMQQRIARIFPQLEGNTQAQVRLAWGGFVDITANRAPDFGRIRPNVYYLQGFSGHGVALTNLAGLLVAEAISSQAERFDLFAAIDHRTFPGGRLLRTPSLALAMIYYRLRDLC